MPPLYLLLVLAILMANASAFAADRQNAEAPTFRAHFQDPNYDYELLRTMGAAGAGAADIVECLKTAEHIIEGDGESWFQQWRALASEVEIWANESLARGSKVSAREAFLRASNYYRTSYFFLHKNADALRVKDAWRKSRDTFRRAAALMEERVDAIRIPYGDTTLPGYFYLPRIPSAPRKTLILQTGFDGTAEELYYSYGYSALRRGYAVLAFEGPGQGGALFEQGLTFVHDWGKVVTAVVDFALTQPEVDRERLALMGLSMGGHLAPRAAATEHRLAALVANPGTYSTAGRGFPSREALQAMQQNPDESNKQLRQAMAGSVGLNAFISTGMHNTGSASPLDFLLFYDKYTLDGLVQNITTPTLVVVSGSDIFLTAEAQRVLYDRLRGPKSLLELTARGYAGAHCQVGAGAIGAMHIFAWLDQTLGD